MLTTAFYLVADSQTGVMRYANAGHPKPLRVQRSTGVVEPLVNASGKSQPALGLFEEMSYLTSEATLAPGDFLMLFTDGLYEVQGLNEELYSQQRLVMDVQNLIQRPPEMLFDELLEAVRTFAVSHEFDDDVCLVGMEFARQRKSDLDPVFVRVIAVKPRSHCAIPAQLAQNSARKKWH